VRARPPPLAYPGAHDDRCQRVGVGLDERPQRQPVVVERREHGTGTIRAEPHEIDTTAQARSDWSHVSPVVPRFEVDEHSADGAHVINVRGEIHVTTAPEFSQRLTSAIEAGSTALVLDLSGVEFIDSTGLSVLLNALRRVHQLHGAMALVCANPTVLRLFEITKLDSTFDIFGDRASAVAHVSGAAGPGSC